MEQFLSEMERNYDEMNLSTDKASVKLALFSLQKRKVKKEE